MVPCYLIQAVLSEFMAALTRRAALAKRKTPNESDVVDALESFERSGSHQGL